jgi:hypothetical protein
MDDRVGERVIATLGETAARELLDLLERSDADRAALIGRVHVRDDAAWLADLLMDLEDDVGEIARLRLIYALRRPSMLTGLETRCSHNPLRRSVTSWPRPH